MFNVTMHCNIMTSYLSDVVSAVCYGNVARWLAGSMSHVGIVAKRLTYLKTFSTIW